MRIFIVLLSLLASLSVTANEIKTNDIKAYQQAQQKNQLVLNNKTTNNRRKKINDLQPLPPVKRPSLNGNFYNFHLYNRAQKSRVLTPAEKIKPTKLN